VKSSLSQQRKSGSAIPHSFDQLELVDMALDHSIVLRKGKPCHNSGFA
jgi:hypothetical protein